MNYRNLKTEKCIVKHTDFFYELTKQPFLIDLEKLGATSTNCRFVLKELIDRGLIVKYFFNEKYYLEWNKSKVTPNDTLYDSLIEKYLKIDKYEKKFPQGVYGLKNILKFQGHIMPLKTETKETSDDSVSVIPDEPNETGITIDDLPPYFEIVFEAAQSGEEFPFDLEDLWALVYSDRRDAVKALCNTFIQDVDYQSSWDKSHKPSGGRPPMKYKLSVPCMEFFIARKKREVFEVYRRVFHRAVETVKKEVSFPSITSEFLFKIAKELEKKEETVKYMAMYHEREIESLEERLSELENNISSQADKYTIFGYAMVCGIHLNTTRAEQLGKRALGICKTRNLDIRKIPHPVYGEVRTYPSDILKEVFSKFISEEIDV
jgi:hypothetical protein